MKSAPAAGLYDLPLPDVRIRADRTRALLREAQSRIASALAPSGRNRVGTLKAIDEALAAVDEFMPGLMELPRTLLARAIRNLAPDERAALRGALDAERAARERLMHLLGDVPPDQAEDVLVRVEIEESITAELSTFFRAVEQASRTPTLWA